MTSKRKKIVLIFIAVFVLALAGLFSVKYLVSSKFEEVVENLPKHIDLQYDTVDFNIISGNMTLENPLVTIKGQITDDINAQIALKTLEIIDLSYWEFYNNDAIDLESVKLTNPKITYYHNNKVEGSHYNGTLKGKSEKTFSIGELNIDNAEIEVYDIDNDSLIFSSESLNLQLSSVLSKTSKTSRTSKLPFTFDEISINGKNLICQLNDYDHLFVKSVDINSENSKLSEVKLKTKYSKEAFSKHLKTERDHFDLSIASVEIKNHNVVLEKDSMVVFEASNVFLNTLDLKVYRNKLVTDDVTHKSLYSKLLRDLNFGIGLGEITIKNGQIIYEEKVKADNIAGTLEFSNLDASIKNVSNLNKDAQETTISISSNFMKDTPLKVNWNFDVNDVNDRFIFKVDLGVLQAEHLNQFMQPNLNVKLEGELLKTYFTIDGNANTSRVDLKTDYDQFDVILLKEDGKEKNKLLSGLINLFISKTSKDESDNYRYSDAVTVERDKTKSIFNFVWKNAQSGLVSAMVGDGKKD